jgi:aspartate ammonia-lyase
VELYRHARSIMECGIKIEVVWSVMLVTRRVATDVSKVCNTLFVWQSY